MKKAFFTTATALILVSCNHTDPVEFNDTIVAKMDSVVGYQSTFIADTGKMGDTMKVAMDKLNAYTDKSIASINKMPEYSDGEDFRKAVIQILNNLKTANMAQGNRFVEIYTKANNGEEVTDADYENIDKVANEYDKIWDAELKKFDAEQKKYAEKTGIQIQKVATPLK